ncbi:ABC transporter substrate-binding protein [Halovenus marina]|uniref:ABC transporter substrate-binding protein n=1 Tax=Halovenus marina TaxID=3396621 RepID=UPI003F56D482
MPTRRDYLKSFGAMAAVTSVAGCTAFGGGGSSWDSAIGIALPLSGPLGPAGQAMESGANVAADQVTEEMDVEIRTEDSAGTVEDTRSAGQSLIDEDTPIVVGVPGSDTALAMREVAEDEEVPFATIAANPNVTQDGTDFTFRTQGSSIQEVKGQSMWFQSEDVNAVSIIGADNSFGETVTEATEDLASNYDYEVDHTALLPTDTTNFVPEIEQIDTDVTDAVFTPFPGGNAPTLVTQLKESGVFEDVIHVGNSSYGSNLFQSGMGENVVGVGAWSIDTSGDQAQAVAEEMGSPPDSLNIPGYDLVRLAGRALEETDSTDPEAIRDTLRDISYDGAYGGSIEFGENGYNLAYRPVYGRWAEENGEIVQNPAFVAEEPVQP